MVSYIIRRILMTVPILLGTQLLLFYIFFSISSPEQIARSVKGEKAKEEELSKWIEQKGYDRPTYYNSEEKSISGKLSNTIFFTYMKNLSTFNFGKSDYDDMAISYKLRDGVGPSLLVTVPIVLVSLIISVFISMMSAMFRETYIDRMVVFSCVVAMSVVYFLYIIGSQFLMAVELRWFPISGWSNNHYLHFLLLPFIIGTIANIGESTRFYRTIMINEINSDYIRTARAKGLGDMSIMVRHLLRNAMIPILTRIVMLLPYVFTGSLLLESFFGIPGLGRLTVDSITLNDFSTISAVVYLSSMLYILANLINDISYTVVDPRVRLK
jgi:peptide/nickel transport system permease protein